MAIYTAMLSLVIPIQIIEEKYPGGWAQCRADHASGMGWGCWHDDELFYAGGAMSPDDMEILVQRWIAIGFDAFEAILPVDMDPDFIGPLERYYCTAWKDICVTTSSGTTLYCPWLEMGTDQKNWIDAVVRLKGGRNQFIVGSDLLEGLTTNVDDIFFEEDTQPTFEQSLYRFYSKS